MNIAEIQILFRKKLHLSYNDKDLIVFDSLQELFSIRIHGQFFSSDQNLLVRCQRLSLYIVIVVSVRTVDIVAFYISIFFILSSTLQNLLRDKIYLIFKYQVVPIILL
jgi:hypothetical protein